MKLSDYITRCKIKIPNLKATGLDDPSLTVIINEGVVEVNLIAEVYRGFKDFNVVANQSIYSLGTNVPKFQKIVTAGLWFTSTGLSKDLKRIIPVTEEWLNKKVPSWRQASSGTIPQYYYQSGDDLVVYPPVSAALANGFRLFHVILPTDMPNGDSYPFTGTAQQITAFRPLDNAVIEYVRWQLNPALNLLNGEDQSYPRFVQLVKTAARQCKSRPDAIGYYDRAVSFST